MPLVPLLVVAAPLPGSVRPVMSLLQAMPEACTEWCPATDRRVLAYLVRHAAVLGAGVEPTPQWDTETLFHPPEHQLPPSRGMAGFPAPGDPALDAHGEAPMWRTMLQANWRHYGERLPAAAGRRLYVEPGSAWLAEAMVLAELPHRILLLARDPRGELIERWLQGRRTGVLDAELTHVDTLATFAERVAHHGVRDWLRDLAQVTETPEQTCVRYEDVVERPAEAWRQLRRWLELPELPAPDLPPTGHEWPAARWRPHLTEAVAALYRDRMQPELEAFGHGV
ncbi:MAG: hypothetical protein KF830_06995 [Planctomycetes bacterium]|nr:hypothetical protein [Planctomycetota bacterium]